MSSKKEKMLPESSRDNSNLSIPENTIGGFLGNIYSELNPGDSTNIQLSRNRDDSATIRCLEQGKTMVARGSGNNVGYSYKPKKK